LQKKRILVVDDEADIRNLINIFLRGKGYEVTTASNGDEALTKAALEKPDLVLLDILMPEMSGFDVCTSLKKNADTARVPVIMCSVLARNEDRTKAFQVGAASYLTKPFNFEAAARVIEDILRGK
jgi:two-component system sensor histidine kinase ChiS